MLLRIILFPFSLLFGVITFVRNKLYDRKYIPSVEYNNICVIGVGNITVGGTGKTPHVEYLIRLLSPSYKIAVLSLGYKRTSKGFLFVKNMMSAEETGDEPYQIKRKFPDIVVAVSKDRVEGIEKIREFHPDIKVILLDDAFQYRRIKPALSILLADYNRPLYRDGMLPGGRLREWPSSAERADMMIITKSPDNISDDTQRDIMKEYERYFSGKFYFTNIMYGEPLPVFPVTTPISTADMKNYHVLLVTGIANPKPLEDYVRAHAASVQIITHPDHHMFSADEITHILQKFEEIPHQNKRILTTEKDAARFRKLNIPDAVARNGLYIPIEINFIGDGKSDFDQKMIQAAEKVMSGDFSEQSKFDWN